MQTFNYQMQVSSATRKSFITLYLYLYAWQKSQLESHCSTGEYFLCIFCELEKHWATVMISYIIRKNNLKISHCWRFIINSNQQSLQNSIIYTYTHNKEWGKYIQQIKENKTIIKVVCFLHCYLQETRHSCTVPVCGHGGCGAVC